MSEVRIILCLSPVNALVFGIVPVVNTCGNIKTLWEINFPLMKPTLETLVRVMWTIVHNINYFFIPMNEN
jgi:hypothetical protein